MLKACMVVSVLLAVVVSLQPAAAAIEALDARGAAIAQVAGSEITAAGTSS